MRIIKSAKHNFETFFKRSGIVYDNIQKPLNDYFLKRFSLDDAKLQKAVAEENYEEAARIKNGYKDEAEDISNRMANDVESEIDKLGIPYRFENLSGARGIAVNGYCVISNDVLKYPPHRMMRVIFHELAHHYQYRKYGSDFVEDIYVNDEDKLEEDVAKLQAVESTADKFAAMKTNFYIRKYDLSLPLISSSGGSNSEGEKASLKRHLLRMKQMVREMPPEKRNIHDINEALYNMIKGVEL